VPQLEHMDAIEKRLWGAADTLRANSNYAGNEYFLPVMGLIFLHRAACETGGPRRTGRQRLEPDPRPLRGRRPRI
jgi:type I restriction enzyme M protein